MHSTDISALGPRLLDLLPQIVWTARPDGGLDYYNQRWFDYTGMTLEQTQDWGWKPVLHPDDLDQCVERWTAAVANGSAYEVEYRFKRASDGAYRWHLGRAQPLRDEHERIVKWFGTCTDIHDQKLVQASIEHARSELDHRVRLRTADLATANALMQQSLNEKDSALLALLASERRFSSVVGSSRAGIFTCDERGTIVTWNQAAERMFGYTGHEAFGISSGDLMPERFRQEHRLELGRIAADAPAAPTENPPVIQGVRKDGNEFPLELSLATWLEGPRRFFSGIMQDVTDRQRAEAELRANEELKRRILESSSDCIKVLDLDGKLRSINGPGCLLLEMDKKVDFIGGEWVSFWTGDAAEQAQQAVASAKTGKPGRFSGFCPTVKGTPKWWDVAVTPIMGKSGIPELLLVSSRDISDLKKTQDELEESRVIAEAATHAKGEFLANMSHEIRTPMNGVLGMLTLLEDTSLSAEQLEMTRTASSSADALLAIIDDILDYTKIESGKMQFEEKDFDPRAVADDTIRLLRPRADEKKLALSVMFGPGVPSSVCGDSGRFRQVLMNLLGNALKFTLAGRVRVELSAPGFDPELTTPQRFEMSVSDTGIGIPPEKCLNLFKPFEQADPSISRRFGGSGLGLAISHRLCALMGGGVSVTSLPGVGSTFIAHFSFRAGKPIQQIALKKALPRLRGRVLVVDDNPVNQIITVSFCRKLGLDVETANDGVQAIAAISASTFALVLMDCQMPIMDGLQATRLIRQQESSSSHVPIIAITASVLEEDLRACTDAGMDACLAKPLRMEVLASTVGRYLSPA